MQGLWFSIELMALGFTVVLVVLFLLNIIFQAFGTFLTNDTARKESRHADKVMEQEKKDISTEPKGLLKETEAAASGISPEIIAVITSAVSAYLERPGYQLRVKKIRRGDSLAPWVLSGSLRCDNYLREGNLTNEKI
ncbi:OadG family protein [Candidatus Contubernalis alkaliaceticus]|uniref:OadG family protein n=1 Tax=Candidatus Contubernalis alkaliaceticus TaxID=338645 RepID=UPI001F4BD61C|nr:OadG family protein [Candidatus Contubernalis alkalaceticus]UNC91875.1 OadG family protein [Candidatus Contubernalis alkalaceticus]